MNWTTIYISGKGDFKDDVLKSLRHSYFKFMPGYSENNDLALFWIDEKAKLGDFKRAIGSKIVFKYRLHFFTSVEEFVEAQTNRNLSFTKEEQAMIKKMKVWEKSQSRRNLMVA